MYHRNNQKGTVINSILTPNQPLGSHTKQKQHETTCFHANISKGNRRNTSSQKSLCCPPSLLLEKQGPDCGETCLAIAGCICLSWHRRHKGWFTHSTHDILSSCHTSLADVSIRYSNQDAAVHLADEPAKDSASKGLKIKAKMIKDGNQSRYEMIKMTSVQKRVA